MKISIEQFNPKTSGFELNSNYIKERISNSNSDVLNLFPELSLSGMPLFEFVSKKETYQLASKYSQEITDSGKDLIFGTPVRIDKEYFNSLVFISQGELIGISTKKNLGYFDKGFSSGDGFETIKYIDKNIGYGFLEDLIDFNTSGLDLVFVFSNNVFTINSQKRLLEDLIIKTRKLSCPIIYVNRIGAEGGYLFSGQSLIINQRGEVVDELKIFENDSKLFDTDNLKLKNNNPIEKNESIFRAMVFALSDYFSKNGIKKAVMGLSGGIDSALVAVIAAYSLGKDNLVGLIMPSEYSSDHSVQDAKQLAENLQIEYHILPIKESFNQVSGELNSHLLTSFNVADENLQSRLRCLFLMWFANKLNAGLLNTTNKSEAAVGYGTLYGDTSGAISILGDLLKTQVWEVSKWLNKDTEIIPLNSINKPPSAELRPNQKDSDSLPEYDQLDRIIIEYIENKKSEEEIITEFGFNKELVSKTIRLIKINEWKRRQCPTSIKLSDSCFGLDIRFPIS